MEFSQFSLRAAQALSHANGMIDPYLAAYTREYEVLVDWFSSNQGQWDRAKVRLAGLAVYGWMPTILRAEKKLLNEAEVNGFFDAVAVQLNGKPEEFPEQNFNFLNRSVVGTSKFLHFWAPNHFAIWDSRICSVLHNHQIANNADLYLAYSANIRRYAHENTTTLRKVEFALFSMKNAHGPA